jgi:transposase
MHIIQAPLFDFEAFIHEKSNDRLIMILEALPSEKLIATLEREHRKGRKGHPIRGMWSALIAGVLEGCKTLAAIPRLLKRDKEVRMICGFSKDKIPDEDAFGRFVRKLAGYEYLLEECFSGLVARLTQVYH